MTTSPTSRPGSRRAIAECRLYPSVAATPATSARPTPPRAPLTQTVRSVAEMVAQSYRPARAAMAPHIRVGIRKLR